jgi:uncharacterized protein YkwD
MLTRRPAACPEPAETARWPRLARLTALAAGALLAACGGGADGPTPGTAAATTPPPATSPVPTPSPAPSSSAGAMPAPPPAPAGAPAPAPAPPPVALLAAPSATCSLSNFATDLLDRVNRLRAAGATCGSQAFAPARALAYEARLHQAASAHSQDMVSRSFFSHTGSNGSSPGQRVTATGYVWTAVGENIAAGYGSVAAAVDGWAASPGHCANLMNPNFTQLGIACVPGAAGSPYRTYWTMKLARPR